MERRNADNSGKMNYVWDKELVFHYDALFSDCSIYYRSPAEPDPGDIVTVRFRTEKNNVDAVFLVSGNKKQKMRKYKTVKGFDFYKTEFTMGEHVLQYYFEIQCGRFTCYYDYRGVSLKLRKDCAFEIYPGYHTPNWAKGAVMYQIFVDRFYNGDTGNDVETGEYCYIGELCTKVENWSKTPAPMGVREFYGGDLKGVMEKLDYLQDLGVDVIYLNPVFVSPSNHKYDCQDYDYIDPHFGRIVEDCEDVLSEGAKDNSKAKKYIKRVTDKRNLEASNQLFIELVEEIHKRGMKIILDGVFNHCGSFNKWMDRERIYEGQKGYEPGAYISEKSPYRSFFDFKDEKKWPYNPTYDGWWSHDTLPKLNYEGSRELYEYVLGVAKKWVSPPYNIDGWRLDVAADLGHNSEMNHQFWKDFRKTVREGNPNAVILAEHYGNPESWLFGDQWDTVMNYDAFMEPLTWFLTGMEKHSDEYREELYGNSEAFIDSMKTHMRTLHMSALYSAMNELSNHDHSRFLTRTNHKVGRVAQLGADAASKNVEPAVMREAVVVQMTWPGSPTLYYGDEAGVCGFTDPDNRRTYPWGHEDRSMIAFHKKMIALHKKYKVLKDGSLKFVWSDDHGLGYGRFSDTEQIIVLLNNDRNGRTMPVNVSSIGFDKKEETHLTRLMLTDRTGFNEIPVKIEVKNGIAEVFMPQKSAAVLYHKDQEQPL